jgi:uncharacterized membrane protein (UPF0127 family)
MIVVFDAPDQPMVFAEVAENDFEHHFGLMFDDNIADGRGMLFVFDHPQQLRFTMTNTPISLDMVFMGADGKVLGVEEMTEPLSTRLIGTRQDAQYVLEVPGGWTANNSVVPGTQAFFVEGDVA